AGFSFGAYVSLRAAAELRPALLLSIAPPAGRWDFDAITLPTMPWLVIQGESDEIVDPQAVYDWLEQTGAQAELVRMPDTSHFVHRKLIDLRGAIKHGVRAYLPTADDCAGSGVPAVGALPRRRGTRRLERGPRAA